MGRSTGKQGAIKKEGLRASEWLGSTSGKKDNLHEDPQEGGPRPVLPDVGMHSICVMSTCDAAREDGEEMVA